MGGIWGAGTGSSGGGGVTSIIAGANVTISPAGGTGDVTINATAGTPTIVTSTYNQLSTDTEIICNSSSAMALNLSLYGLGCKKLDL
jgi:hypothetical protein